MTKIQGYSGGATPTLRTGRPHPHPDPISGVRYSAVELMPEDQVVLMLDQRKLPLLERYEHLARVDEVADAIREMVIRGAPAIGIAGAYGMVLAAGAVGPGREAFLDAMRAADTLLRETRPTAVNLSWALDRMRAVVDEVADLAPSVRVDKLANEARTIHRNDLESCRKIGELGAHFIPDKATILTHCNAGALATGGYGTALGIVRAAREAHKSVRVMATETRPFLQGARLTAWELSRDFIPVDLITDSMVAHFFAQGMVQVVVVGADRIARNGDVANKIGTYGIACLARTHGVPFYVAAPWSTVDLECSSGSVIPIEERSETEVTYISTPEMDVRIAPEGVRAKNPAFDVTPARLITAIITDRGVVSPVSEENLVALH